MNISLGDVLDSMDLTNERTPGCILNLPQRLPLSTGIPAYDMLNGDGRIYYDELGNISSVSVIGGIDELTMLAGQPGVGKSTISVQILLSMLRKNPTATVIYLCADNGLSLTRMFKIGLANGFSPNELRRLIGIGSEDEIPVPEEFGESYRLKLSHASIDMSGFWEVVFGVYTYVMSGIGCKFSTEKDTRGRILSWPAVSDAELLRRIAELPPVVIVVDPLSVVPPREKATSRMAGIERAGINAASLSEFARRGNTANIKILIVNHVNPKSLENPTMAWSPDITSAKFIGSGNTVPGGMAFHRKSGSFLIFQQSVPFGGDIGPKKTKDIYGEVSGHTIIATIVKSRVVGAGQQLSLVYVPAIGISEVLTYFEHLVARGYFQSSGRSGFFVIPGLEEQVSRKSLELELTNPTIIALLRFHFIMSRIGENQRFLEVSNVANADTAQVAAMAIATTAGLEVFKRKYAHCLPAEIQRLTVWDVVAKSMVFEAIADMASLQSAKTFTLSNEDSFPMRKIMDTIEFL